MKRVILVLAIVAAALGALAIRVVVEGRAALAEGDELLAQGRPLQAIRAYETAARWYLPLAPHVDEAYARLREQTAAKHPGLQLAAWRSIRGAARASRSLWTPHADDLAVADRKIAELAARDPASGRIGEVPAGGGEAPAGTAEERAAWHQARLARDARAEVGALALAGFGILAWLGGALAMTRRGLDASGRLVRRPALAAAAAIVVGLACWMLGLHSA